MKRKAESSSPPAAATHWTSNSGTLLGFFKASKPRADLGASTLPTAVLAQLFMAPGGCTELGWPDGFMEATRVLEHSTWSSVPEHVANEGIGVLMATYGNVFDMLGGDRSAVLREWIRLRNVVVKDAVLRDLGYSELYARLFIHFTSRHENVLLLAAVVHAAWMYNGPALLLTLKKEKAGERKAHMLLYMMGKAWGGSSKGAAVSISQLVKAWLGSNGNAKLKPR